MEKFKLKVRNVHVYTNLEVRLKSRTTKEEANKEVERMVETKDIFKGYEWKIEGCEEGGINSFNSDLIENIIERINQEETDENIFWDGFTAHYDLNVSHIPVNTNLEAPLKSDTREDAIKEVKALCENPFKGYEWKIENCDENGINEFNEDLKNQIVQIIGKDLVACIEGND
ncbi:MAG: hypothetical protein CMH75_00295 [Nitrospina sp.]|nr:hypothetical protein [Nitrospina sp.]|tara:strand:- start:701 stop:1216 length:516 start_codon:yes stop_codon:yes gene_type:complete